MRWIRLAIQVFVVLPMLLVFTGVIVRLILDPLWTPWESAQLRMWLYLILPAASAVLYGVSIYAKNRGHFWSGYAKALAWFVIIPSLFIFYFEVMLLLFIIIHGGWWTAYM